MPPLMSTSKESPRGDVCAAVRHGVISTAETMSTAAEARNLHRLIILLCSLFEVAYWTARPQPKFAVERRTVPTENLLCPCGSPKMISHTRSLRISDIQIDVRSWSLRRQDM